MPWNIADPRAATTAERALLRTVEGGCQVPVGAFAEVTGDERSDRFEGYGLFIGRSQGSRERSLEPPEEAEALGVALAEDLFARGGEEILDEIRGGTAWGC